MDTSISTLRDPRQREPKPPFTEPKLQFPGLERDMHLKPNHGETTYQGNGRLTGRRALITGGDSGIGAAVALAFAREGADVAIAHLPEEQEDADRVVSLIADEGRTAVSLTADLCEAGACQGLAKQAVEALGGVDILVNNAAYQRAFEKLEDITEEEFDRTFRTNVYGTFFLTQAMVPHLPPGSVIINTTSVQSYDPSPILLPYAATKGAITNLTKSFSGLLIKQGIRVNAVAPGPVWSPLNPMAMPSVQNFGSSTPMGRPAQPDELAPIYVFLASNEASYITGAIYEVTGGETTS